jgi:hypothetical protein
MRLKALVIVGALALSLAWAGSAFADKTTYAGRGTTNTSVLVLFEVVGKNVARGSKDFGRGAEIRMFRGDSFRWPLCPDVVDASMEFPKPIPVKFKGHTPTFRATGTGAGPGSEGAKVTIEGRFTDRGNKAHGAFEVVQGPCSSGRVAWEVKPG